MILQKGKHQAKDFLPDAEVTKQLAELKEVEPKIVDGPEDAFAIVSNFTIEKLSATNGLSIEDNKALFSRSDIRQALSLILKGLKKVRT